MKNGYVPQEEVPLYESKGKQLMKKSALPVGMCPIVAQEAKVKREKQLQKQQQQQPIANSIPGLIQLPSASLTAAQKPKQSTKSKSGTNTAANKSGTTTTTKPTPSASATGTATTTASTSKPSTKSKNISTNHSNDNVKDITKTICNLNLATEDELAKKLKKLRKKIREIEAIEAKLASGELKNPEQDQLDKIGRKQVILKELREAENFQGDEL